MAQMKRGCGTVAPEEGGAVDGHEAAGAGGVVGDEVGGGGGVAVVDSQQFVDHNRLKGVFFSNLRNLCRNQCGQKILR